MSIYEENSSIFKLRGFLGENSYHVHTEKTFWNLIIIQTEIRLYLPFPLNLDPNERVHLVPNQSENGKYNLVSV